MNAREAKREACWRAAVLVSTAMYEGWPFNESGGLPDLPDGDERRVDRALLDLLAELERRGWHGSQEDRND